MILFWDVRIFFSLIVKRIFNIAERLGFLFWFLFGLVVFQRTVKL